MSSFFFPFWALYYEFHLFGTYWTFLLKYWLQRLETLWECHASRVTYRISCITFHVSHIMHHVSCLTYHDSGVTLHISRIFLIKREKEKKKGKKKAMKKER